MTDQQSNDKLNYGCNSWCNTIFQKSFQSQVLHFADSSTLNNCISIRLPRCNTPKSITPVLHQITKNGVILSRVLHRT